MTGPKMRSLHVVRETDETVERALAALTEVMKDKAIPYLTRVACAKAHTELHACRSPETVRRMEQERGLTRA